MFRKLFIGMVIVLLVLVTGCQTKQQSSTTQTTTTKATTTNAQTSTTEATVRTITDMAGREVVIPKTITRVASDIPSGTMILYSIDPDLLVAWNYEFNEEEIEYIKEEYRELPVIGQAAKINKEVLISLNPDVIIAFNGLSESEIADANTLSTTTGIPVVMVDHSLDKTPEAYRFLGDVLNLSSRCETLAAYAEAALEFAESIEIPENERIKVYYGNGADSLETVPVNSSHATLFVLLDVKNVANISGGTRVTVTGEQVMGWNPDVVLVNGDPTSGVSPKDAVDSFKANSLYQNVNAVKNDRVYAIPKYPFSWFDRPQSTNRLIGIYWLSDILYDNLPEGMNISDETKDFYELFYHLELTDEQVEYLLGLD